ncbi:MAG TPA: MASE1 domain-containing protein, partial [Candidatus Krumholzibacteria bacterium]|nr:MASE1 domain-containing protein [Candidatus Krumholzibacteria bacterium]
MQEESASHSSPRRGGWRGDIACGIALGGAYFAAAMLGLRLASLHASASPVWPPTGIALAALLALGTRMWPAITLGALVANVLVSGSWPVSAGIALGNTLEALIGAGLIRRYARGPQVFEHATDIFRFVGFGALLCTATSATVGVTSLCLGGLASWGDFWSIW